jgi:hypothetical protein
MNRQFILQSALLGVIALNSQITLASDFSFGSNCKNINGQTIEVKGKLLGDKQSVVFNSETVQAVVKNDTGQPQEVTLVAYKEFYNHWNFDDIYQNGQLVKLGQRVHDYKTVIAQPGETILEVEMPGCSTQIDLVCGPVNEYLGGGNLYGSRKLAWYHPHESVGGQDVWCDDGIEDPVTPPPEVCQLSIAEITGITAGESVEPGSTLNIGATINGGSPKKVQFELIGPDGLPVTADSPKGEVTIWYEGVSPYYYLGDGNYYGSGVPNGWDTTDHPIGQYVMKVSVYDSAGWNSGVACDEKDVHFVINSNDTETPESPPLLITSVDFTATSLQNSVLLNWEAVGHVNRTGALCLWRGYQDETQAWVITAQLIPSDQTSFEDDQAMPNRTYYYALESLSTAKDIETCTTQAADINLLMQKDIISISSAAVDG